MIATGRCYSVRQFLETAFAYVGLDYRDYLEIEPSLFRPAEVVLLQGDATKAKQQLGWDWEVSFEDLVVAMVESDLEYFRKHIE